MDFPRLWPAPASAGRDIFDRDTPATPHRELAPACRGRLRRPARRRAASRRPGRAGRASRPRDSRDPVMRTGIIGGRLGYRLLRRLGARTQATASCTGSPYRDRSKVEALFGPGIWRELVGRIVIDFGCGTGGETIEVAQHGAKKVIGIDIRDTVLNIARDGARAVGVSDQCRFSTATDERADVILSIDGFEHYDDPEQVLRVMRRLLKDDGRVFIAFGPPWLHPLGGHLFSVLPWAHLLFTEKALIRWRSDFKSDGATRFSEVAGGLNQMTVRRFRKLLEHCDFAVERFEAVPIRRLRALSNALPGARATAMARGELTPRSAPRARGGQTGVAQRCAGSAAPPAGPRGSRSTAPGAFALRRSRGELAANHRR